ncbi:four helix bundle protein [Horticoccus luteus]|uniref:Four helix bundle protein n=1 Tax=Horticoccus luteus TaxID=2862869 RepID=A0A8F9TU47_9BACT|nr:four helix bundle protein [Horticoccus luteus]QYM78132.1 four helix bundle protein [Horticoccus luteus]
MVKLQNPTSKLHRSAKLQLETKRPPNYAEANGTDWSVGEDSPATGRHPFDLEERTACFGAAIIRFLKKVPHGPNNNRLIDQLVGCGTSIGANYCEANEGVSKKDFRNIIGRCVKEAKETKFFLRMIATSEPALADQARTLYREAQELHLIFASIYRNTKP